MKKDGNDSKVREKIKKLGIFSMKEASSQK